MRPWTKALRHPTTVSTIVYVPVTLMLWGLGHLRPELLARFSWSAYLLGLAYVIGGIAFLARELTSGRFTLARWRRIFLWFVAYPAGTLHAYATAAIPDYFAIGLGLQVTSTLVLIGVYGAAVILGGLIWYLTSGLLFGLLLHGRPTITSDPYADLIIATVWLSYVLGLILTTRYFIRTTDSIRTLLRGSRRDKRTIAEERRRAEGLLLNILPASVAEELKREGKSRPVSYAEVSVLFTDFQGFTRVAETMSPDELVRELDRCFSYFDSLMDRYNLEKLKTIGDSFMCAGGIPTANKTHAIDCVLAALEIQSFMNQMKALKQEKDFPYWELRLGIHTGPLVAGVIGEKKFTYDVWGDTVNTASRMESSGIAGRINVSEATAQRIEEFFECEYRGPVAAKNKGMVRMYFVNRIRPEYSRDTEGRVPSERFLERYSAQ